MGKIYEKDTRTAVDPKNSQPHIPGNPVSDNPCMRFPILQERDKKKQDPFLVEYSITANGWKATGTIKYDPTKEKIFWNLLQMTVESVMTAPDKDSPYTILNESYTDGFSRYLRPTEIEKHDELEEAEDLNQTPKKWWLISDEDVQAIKEKLDLPMTSDTPELIEDVLHTLASGLHKTDDIPEDWKMEAEE